MMHAFSLAYFVLIEKIMADLSAYCIMFWLVVFWADLLYFVYVV